MKHDADESVIFKLSLSSSLFAQAVSQISKRRCGKASQLGSSLIKPECRQSEGATAGTQDRGTN